MNKIWQVLRARLLLSQVKISCWETPSIGQTDILAGGSSGIGLATVELLISLGALVVSGDIQEPPATGDFLFVKTDVRSWTDLTKLFKAAKDKYGRVNYVFANAGIGPRADYLNLGVDENGTLKEPNKDTLDINLNSVINTVTLAAHYLKSQAEGGSIVIMGSSTGLNPVRAVDYCEWLICPSCSHARLTPHISNGQNWHPGLRSQLRASHRSSRSAYTHQYSCPIMDRHSGIA